MSDDKRATSEQEREQVTERREKFLSLMLEDPHRCLKDAAELAGFADPRRQGSRLMSVPAIRMPVDAERKRRDDEFRAKLKAESRARWEAEFIIMESLPMYARRRQRQKRA